MEFREYLKRQLAAHPAARPRDVVKLCHQAACGGGHLLTDVSAAEAYLRQEFESAVSKSALLYEPISDAYCRVHLGAWKAAGLPVEWLARMFVLSAEIGGERERLTEYLAAADAECRDGGVSFSAADWAAYLAEYRAGGMGAVRHTEEYRAAEQPAYRVIHRRLARLLPVLQRAARHTEDTVCVIAVDGRAAGGKSTMANDLARILPAGVVRMDDFFLPSLLRTAERFAAAGGNVHYERFAAEVLPCLREPDGFSYRRFDCSVMELRGERAVSGERFRIVEGSYSCHPVFGDYADITVFAHVDGEEQTARILRRNGEELAQRFFTEWIPMEERYFTAFGIREKADIVL